PRRVIDIVLKRLREQRSLVAVSIVEAWSRDPHFVGKITHGRRLIAAMPETLDRGLHGSRFVKFPRARHLTLRLIVSLPVRSLVHNSKGKVIEQVTGQDLEGYLRRHILDPLGLEQPMGDVL